MVRSVVRNGPAANSARPPLPGDRLVKVILVRWSLCVHINCVNKTLIRKHAVPASVHTHICIYTRAYIHDTYIHIARIVFPLETG